jgi:phage-related baseplate assembly protein
MSESTLNLAAHLPFNESPNVTSAIDLSKLPPPLIVENISYERILADLKADFMARMTQEYPDYVLAAADPASKLLEASAFREVRLRQRVNDGVKECMLAFSEASNLDHIAAFTNIERETYDDIDPLTNKQRKESDASLRSRSLLSFDRYSTCGAFAAYIFQAKKVGTKLKLFDAYAYSSEDYGPKNKFKVNISLFFEDEKSFEDYSSRLQTIFDQEKTEGKVLDYILGDESEGRVNVSLLFEDQPLGDILKGEALKEFGPRVAQIRNHLLSSEVKPLTDRVSVFPVQVVDVPIEASIFIPLGVDKEIIKRSAVASLRKYAAGKYRVGADIPISGLHAALFVPNVNRVVIDNLTIDRKLAPHEAPRISFSEASIKVEVGE